MVLNKEELKNKIIYRSLYRGTKEMDNLVGSFVKSIINKLDYNDLILLNELINIDDENLYKLNKNLPTSINVKDNKIVNLFRGFCI
tara:strand:- start:1879 stop:2136 length:258 start_codon:yes stop_codon:yes gene_type:complete